ncbi:MAG: hypothetical protein H0W58_10835 [Acidobacteria bacterium]|jgi:DNA-binding beta-propeller fold protein YncE/DNA-directed RNA polymerase subunit RPC12/RpoP|nr:hypothetical protein [Acidobacteriota bacterium]
MKAIICPQCGGLISKITEQQAIVQCDYCGAKVMIPREIAPPNDKPNNTEAKPKLINQFGYPIDQYVPFDKTNTSNNSIAPIVTAIFLIFGIGFIIFLAFASNSKSRPGITPSKPTSYKTPNKTSTTAPTPKKDYEVLLEFGGKGTSAGLFDRPSEIAVDNDGNIYIADDTLRVQHFDEAGKFVNLWNVSGNKNETIDKLAADADGNVYVLIGGEIVVYAGKTGEQKHVLSDKHYIYDFVLRDDGGMMLATENNGRDEIVQTNKGRKIVRRFVEIHSRAAETQIPPQAVRLAVGGKGDIFAVYALGDVYGTFNYNEEDLMTFHFTANGKFVNKFAAGLKPGAILIDNQNRIYLLNDNMQNDAKIIVFSNTGSEIKRIGFDRFESIETMTLDKQNNLFVIGGEKIRKLKAIEF